MRSNSILRSSPLPFSYLRLATVAALSSAFLLLGAWVAVPRPAHAAETTVTGWFDTTWICGSEPGQGETDVEYRLSDGQGKSVRLLLDERVLAPFGGPRGLMGQRVVALGEPGATVLGGSPTLRTTDLKPAPDSDLELLGASAQAATGNRACVTLLLRFARTTASPKPITYFQGLMGATNPGLDHYYRTLSFGQLTLKGSAVVGWLNLPKTQAAYKKTDGSIDLDLLFNDAVATADRQVDFSLYYGINIILNSNPFPGGTVGFGGWRTRQLEGQPARLFGVTWIGRYDQGVLAHEMGHTHGLPHSSGPYRSTYDSKWDVMSNPLLRANRTYGYVAEDMIAYHKDYLGWIPQERRLVVPKGKSATVNLSFANLAPTGRDYQTIQIPLNDRGTVFYTVEARRKSGYDAALPAAGVLLHTVDTARFQTNRRVAQVVDPDRDGDPNDAAAILVVGERFRDAARAITVKVIGKTTTGYSVRINHAVTY